MSGQSQLNYDVHSTSSTLAPIIGEPKMAKSINLALTPIKNIVLAKKEKLEKNYNFVPFYERPVPVEL